LTTPPPPDVTCGQSRTPFADPAQRRLSKGGCRERRRKVQGVRVENVSRVSRRPPWREGSGAKDSLGLAARPLGCAGVSAAFPCLGRCPAGSHGRRCLARLVPTSPCEAVSSGGPGGVARGRHLTRTLVHGVGIQASMLPANRPWKGRLEGPTCLRTWTK
jgi:hypothetical protein